MSRRQVIIDTFKEQLSKNEITDFTPYVNMKPATIQCIMAEKGIMVRELCEQGNPRVLCVLIAHGYGQEYYEQWATHKRKSVRTALAEHGYCFDILINDAELGIREIVYKTNPDYAKYRLDTTDMRELLSLVRMFIKLPNPNPEHVQKLLQNPLYETFGWHTERADIEAKAEALRYPLSPLEQHMSLWQLYEMGHKRFPAFVNGEQRRFLRGLEDTLCVYSEKGQEIFNRFLNGESPYTIMRELNA